MKAMLVLCENAEVNTDTLRFHLFGANYQRILANQTDEQGGRFGAFFGYAVLLLDHEPTDPTHYKSEMRVVNADGAPTAVAPAFGSARVDVGFGLIAIAVGISIELRRGEYSVQARLNGAVVAERYFQVANEDDPLGSLRNV